MLNFHAGLSALRSSQVSMDVIANNIANANTPGYHRQAVNLVESPPLYDGNFWRGTGVDIARINQVASRAVESALTGNISDLGRVDHSLNISRQVETSLANSEGSVHLRMQEFFSEIHQLQGQPDSTTQRQIVVNKSRSLAGEFNSISANLSRMERSTRQEILKEVDHVNQKLDALTKLNKRIARAQATGQEPNSLLDAHQQLVNEIAESIDIEVFSEEHGFTYQFARNTVSISSTTLSLEAEFNNDGTVEFTQTDGRFPLGFGGGRLAGHQQTLNSLLPAYKSQLDDLASTFIQSMNHVQATGVSARGPMELLTTEHLVRDRTIPLADAGLPFTIDAGTLFVSVHDLNTGERTQNQITVDPSTQSLDDIAAAINGLPNMQAVIDPATNGLTIVAQPGYGFDFAGQLPTVPDRSAITGDAVIDFSGVYTGPQNETLYFEVAGSGQVGVAGNLKLELKDGTGQLLKEIDLGAGYEPGSSIDLGDGVQISIKSGQLNDGDAFSAVAVADADSSRLLTGLGMNSFFSGTRASNIQVARELAADPGRLSAGRSTFSGDGSNATRFMQLREQPLVNGDLSFENHASAMTADIAIEVNELTSLKADLGAHQFHLQREREAISGVDPNEEMVQMLQFQRSFQAAVRVISTIDETLAELMNLVR